MSWDVARLQDARPVAWPAAPDWTRLAADATVRLAADNALWMEIHP